MRQFFGDTRLTMCQRVTQTCHGERRVLRARPTGLHHIVQRGRLTDGRGSHLARSEIATARGNRNCPDTPSHRSRSLVGGRCGRSRGCRLAGRYFVHAVRLAPDSAWHSSRQMAPLSRRGLSPRDDATGVRLSKLTSNRGCDSKCPSVASEGLE